MLKSKYEGLDSYDADDLIKRISELSLELMDHAQKAYESDEKVLSKVFMQKSNKLKSIAIDLGVALFGSEDVFLPDGLTEE